jgi:hypothetical protein
MDMFLTLLALAFGLIVIAIAVWREHRPQKNWEPSLEPSLLPPLPTTPFLLFGAVIVVLALSHMATLMGVTH